MRYSIILVVLSIISINTSAETIFEITSKSERNTLLELYTSEGCSSCPPADQWISQFRNDKQLWQKIIPVAFHVDYWDYIGWKDEFASPAYSQRQRSYHRQNYVKSVYTPGFIKNGREWRSWFGLKSLALNDTKRVGVLSAKIKNNILVINYKPEGRKYLKLIANVVLLGFDLKHQVTDGENTGKLLKHDFVVLKHETYPSKNNQSELIWKTTWKYQADSKNKTQAIAIWVTEGNDLTPIQTIGGWL